MSNGGNKGPGVFDWYIEVRIFAENIRSQVAVIEGMIKSAQVSIAR